MSGRKCVNCRHYEPSPIWRSGWCRNPRLYTPQESHLVSQDGMECAHRVGNYWEPIEPAADIDALPDAAGGRGRVSPLRLFGPQPRLLAATASGGTGGTGGSPGGRPPRPGGQGAGSGGGGYDPSSVAGRSGLRGGDPDAGRTFRDAVGAPGGYAGPDRPVQPGTTPGQELPVSYQPEERYWTDYLRIALPVVGLLLMLGLFWFWAASLIGDEDDDGPDDLAAVATQTPVPSPSPSPPPSTDPSGEQSGEVSGTETATAGGDSEDTQTNNGNATGDEDPDAANPDDADSGDADNSDAEEPCGLDFCPGDNVTTNSDDINFREDPSTDSEVIVQFDEGVELTVLDEPQEDDGENVWIPVEDIDGNRGWIASNLLNPES